MQAGHHWDGTTWTSVGDVGNGVATCAVAWDPDGTDNLPAQLVVGGDFTGVGDINANAIARHDMVNWLRVGGFPRVSRINAFRLAGMRPGRRRHVHTGPARAYNASSPAGRQHHRYSGYLKTP